MATVEELVRDVLGSVATSVGAPIAARWVDDRYQDMVSRVRFRSLRSIGELAVPAVVDTGTVTVTRGSTAVAGSSTTFETEIGTGAQTAWFIRPASAWYKIASITDETNLVLDTAFAEDSVSAGSYQAIKRLLAVNSNARWLGEFVQTRLRNHLTLISITEMDFRFPGRWPTGRIPEVVAQSGTDSSHSLTVEIYPMPDTSEIIHYVYWNLPTALAFTSTIPAQIDAHQLKEGVLIDIYRHEKSKALRLGQPEVAAVWRNDERAQMTVWERIIGRASRADRGVDDASFILQRVGGQFRGRFDNPVDAHDIAYNRFTFP